MKALFRVTFLAKKRFYVRNKPSVLLTDDSECNKSLYVALY